MTTICMFEASTDTSWLAPRGGGPWVYGAPGRHAHGHPGACFDGDATGPAQEHISNHISARGARTLMCVLALLPVGLGFEQAT